jgi:hypothetical protein
VKGERILSVTLADCIVETKRGHGKGGQNRNKRDTAVRIVHAPSGAVGESQEERSQYQNKRTAFRRLVESPKFRIWLNREIWVRQGLPSPEQETERAMELQNLRVEVKDERGRWSKEGAKCEG